MAATPNSVKRLRKLGLEVLVASGAGQGARFSDAEYVEAGAEIADDDEAVWSSADLVLKVRPPTPDEVELLPEGGRIVSLLYPASNEDLVDALAAREATVFALDAVPRITRAQAMDVLSSMAGIAGYRAVVEAAYRFGRYFSQQITAAGSTDPARVLVIGAGVAGLAAVATAREMGARVKAFDTRAAVKEEVESLGAEFLTVEIEESGEGAGGYAKKMSDAFLEAERRLFEEEAEHTDIIITTAAIPGRAAPQLLTEAAVEAMHAGSVIIDLAAMTGGNCVLTEAGEEIECHGVTIFGPEDLTTRMPTHASEFLGRNVVNLFKLFMQDEEFVVDLDDEVIRDMTVLHEGELLWPPPKRERKPKPAAAPPAEVAAPPPPEEVKAQPGPRMVTVIAGIVALGLMGVVGYYAPEEFIEHFTVFVLACFVGWQVVWSVTPSLHTPLMSVTNAISGIIVVGGILQATIGADPTVTWLAVGAIAIASVNIFGGFLVTQRMLRMFRLDAGGEDA